MSFVMPVAIARDASSRASSARSALASVAPTRRQRRDIFRFTLLALGVATALAALGLSARSADARVLVIPADDGYGFQECLTSRSACGAMVANAWCEANGLKSPKAFGPAEEFAAAIGEERPVGAAPGSFLVSCGEAI